MSRFQSVGKAILVTIVWGCAPLSLVAQSGTAVPGPVAAIVGIDHYGDSPTGGLTFNMPNVGATFPLPGSSRFALEGTASWHHRPYGEGAKETDVFYQFLIHQRLSPTETVRVHQFVTYGITNYLEHLWFPAGVAHYWNATVDETRPIGERTVNWDAQTYLTVSFGFDADLWRGITLRTEAQWFVPFAGRVGASAVMPVRRFWRR